ncbi:glycerophosphoryl diester phosphodiesterase membrane domain-containing protein [Streptomyces sp. NPDC126499]|uniref:glycerophosphoryl diester phosphodiesterase membrane domain-containing protein n=1 Tax=Streptomyces sp. NPDC126499 TaxID=3155314 RepID=UPI003329E2DF
MNDTPGWASPGSAPSDGQDDAGVPRPSSPGDANDSAPPWSKDQPPAGQWQPPTPPAPGTPPPPPARAQSGPGWGAPPPHGHWGPPPAAKPGVIPLRPLGLGEILDGAVTTLRRYWRTVLTITIAVAVITEVTNVLVQRYLVVPAEPVHPDASPAEAFAAAADAARSALAESAPAALVAMAASLFSAALLTVVMSRAVLGRPVTLAAAWQEARPRLPQLLGLTLLLSAMAAGIMTVGLLPGLLADNTGLAALGALAAFAVTIWLVIRFSLASPALMLERQGVIKALKRSAKLVQGSWWRIFGITILTQAMIFFLTMIVAIPFMILAMLASGDGMSALESTTFPYSWTYLIIMGIGGVIVSAITYPISAGVTVLLYIDQRIRREALDLELARAAGLPGHGG